MASAKTNTIKRLLKARALREGLIGGSPFWRVLWISQFAYKQFSKLSKGGEPPITFDEPLKEGEVWAVVHEPEKTKKGRGEGRRFLIGPKRKKSRANTMTGLALGVVGQKILEAPSAERINQILGEDVFEPPPLTRSQKRAAKKASKADAKLQKAIAKQASSEAKASAREAAKDAKATSRLDAQQAKATSRLEAQQAKALRRSEAADAKAAKMLAKKNKLQARAARSEAKSAKAASKKANKAPTTQTESPGRSKMSLVLSALSMWRNRSSNDVHVDHNSVGASSELVTDVLVPGLDEAEADVD